AFLRRLPVRASHAPSRRGKRWVARAVRLPTAPGGPPRAAISGRLNRADAAAVVSRGHAGPRGRRAVSVVSAGKRRARPGRVVATRARRTPLARRVGGGGDPDAADRRGDWRRRRGPARTCR